MIGLKRDCPNGSRGSGANLTQIDLESSHMTSFLLWL